MQLKKIKLAGFKSFVDPTTVAVPSSLVAIVGPNGCGKSNIIDAVCWVMGESSAKYLRGESLTDVIFNGSTARKPVGQASVELVFDNQDGSLGGEYASYAEISIRRVINRDSESNYFLNGTRCRRRDIIDIFLGTGLGPRSYSIIGQNMISRIIEAKPDDMRTYLEEAAGVSKYKERRRETENRIHHTKENLARLDDVRNELDKQLNSLKRQASAAERYKVLKQEERIVRAQWLGAQWRQLDGRLVQYTLEIQQQETGLESKHADLSETNLALDKGRESQRLASEALQDVQRRFYTAGSEITRIEQEIRHTQEKQQQWQADVAQVAHDCEQAESHLHEVDAELERLVTELQQLEPALQHAADLAKQAASDYAQTEEAMQDWQYQWEEFNQRSSKTTQTAQVEQTRISHLEQRLASIKQRQMKLEQEYGQLDFSQLDNEIAGISQQLDEVASLSDEQTNQLSALRQRMTEQQASLHANTQQLDQVRNTVQTLRGQQASLEALQQTALGQRNNTVNQWLSKFQLDKKPRLAQDVVVEAGWEQAVEKVLGTNLQAVCVDALSDVSAAIKEFKQGNICVFAGETSTGSAVTSSKADLLLSKITTKRPLSSLLTGIYAVETQEDAFALCEKLDAHESVITRDGVWLSPAWLRISRDENPAAGVFQREQELKQLAKQIVELTETQSDLENSLSQGRETLKDLERQRDELQKTVNQTHAHTAQLQAQRKMKQERLTEFKARTERFRNEQEETTQQIEQTQTELVEARSVWQRAMAELEELAIQRDRQTQERDQLRDRVQRAREKMHETKDRVHELEIRLQSLTSQQASQQQSAVRVRSHLASLNERKQALQSENQVGGTPIAELEKSLSLMLGQRLHIENELNNARSNIEAIDQEIRDLESKRHSIEREIAKYRDMLETLRLQTQGLKVKSETLAEQLAETQYGLEEILQELPEDISPEDLHQQLEQVSLKITRLGPINLVAIEEYASCSERKQYLDKQRDDLQEGLDTLENAIAKIDKETRARFKETFDKVNERFQELFPKIFGGGRSYLELTGENLLDAGITVMACPPGKRNSSIHLLSGGEKAMTAIALVFSIFHLNPAPFCLLDEVDAPLDDANIGRFCDLVKAMSEKTQFIFISHNKLAIEMGQHLMGVTMHEPGVSRLVSVNVDEAVSLAGA